LGSWLAARHFEQQWMAAMATRTSANLISHWQRSVSIFIPALNEEENLKPTVARLIEALTVTVEDYEIIVIDDASSDRTGAVANSLAMENSAIRVLHNSHNMGLGYCFAQGYREARKDFFVYIPGDNTWPYRSFVELFGNLGRADVVTSYAINPDVRPFGRRVVSRLYTRVLNLLFGRHLQYFNGLTIYPVDFLRRNPATTFGFGFQAEVLLKALNLGLSYIEVGLPIDERAAGRSKAVNLTNIVSVLATLIRVFIDLRIMRHRQLDEWSPNVRAPHGAMSIEELGFDPEVQASLAHETDPAVRAQFVLVAGASSGIGAALARDLSSVGYQVLACSRSLDRLRAAFADYPNVQYLACDVSNVAAVAELVELVRERTERLDVLINCAGGFGAIGAIDQIDAAEWMRTVSNNLFGSFLTIKHFLPLLANSPAPRVINLSGGGAFSPFPNYSAYACSKAALVRLTETLAIELAPHGIAINALAPGFVATRTHETTISAGPEKAGQVQFHRTQRLLRQPDDGASDARMETVCRCVRALVSPAYRGLTGKTISANFDPWASDAFRRYLDEITRSELYTMRRTNLVNLPEGHLRTSLMKTWAKHGIKR
jgi:NAD(P)-dependent dehydrogenase (short-subunit alcohol dehydrogenase family)